MALTLYGSPQSRTKRVLWTLAELGLDYTHIPLAFDDPALKTPEFLAMNPAGAIPTLVDDGFAISESLAINLYLARKYGAERLGVAALEDEARAWRWTLWAQGHLEPWVMRDALLADVRAAVAPHVGPVIEAGLGTLARGLGDGPWLGGRAFGVADLNVAAVLSPSRAEHVDFGPFPTVRDWLTRCYARPAAIETRRLFQS
jgi:glutathione S-transferase